MSLKLSSSNLFLLENNEHMLHLGTITQGLREFWVMLCVQGEHNGKCYIEEYVPTSISFNDDIFGHFKFIKDDELAEELARFAERKKLTDIPSRINELKELGKVHWVMK